MAKKTIKKPKKAPKAAKAAKPWGGRFTEATNRLVEEYTASTPYDWRLYPYDIAGSIAHATMLAKTGIIARKDSAQIIAGLRGILAEIAEGRFEFSLELEDIHMNIEDRLIKKIGPVGGKLHTARSRNDQVALDLRMYLRDCFGRVNVLPLGSGALAGTVLPIDRKFTAKLLLFDSVCENSMDGVSDRDFAIEFVAACCQVMMHVSRLAEELVLWSSSEFGFITLSDAFTTGSSIMPQKKNPDVAELGRGKTGRVYGNLTALLTIMKGLPLAYNRDMQEDKEPVFDTADTVTGTLAVFAGMLAVMTVNRDAMRKSAEDGFITATDLADYLVRKGVPFRQAHDLVGRAVLRAMELRCGLMNMPLDEYQKLSPLVRDDVYEALSVEASVGRRTSAGGTAPTGLKRRIEALKKVVK